MTIFQTCVSPEGIFKWGVHKPHFRAKNLRKNDCILALGRFTDGSPHQNHMNFPSSAVDEPQADWIYEVYNPFPFKGATYIVKTEADRKAADPSSIRLAQPPDVSFSAGIRDWMGKDLSDEQLDALFKHLPGPVLLTLASSATDPEELVRIADSCCEFIRDPNTGRPTGLVFEKDDQGRARPRIHDHTLFEVLVNNYFLPEEYKTAMALRPGVQGGSEIVGEWLDQGSHVFEYLRRNSYIPWGHYAANMAHDAVRYRIRDLSFKDMRGMRHLYYQRTYCRVAEEFGINIPGGRETLGVDNLESLRKQIVRALADHPGRALGFSAALWGWNYGFGYAASGYRLHASHQQIHQQYALVPEVLPRKKGGESSGGPFAPFSCGDLITDFIERFHSKTKVNFFEAYIRAIRNNRRMDGRKGPDSLVVYQDDHVMLFVPKAQTSQWELHLMTEKPVGSILEADTQTRTSLDRGIMMAMSVLESMGARMITVIEMSRRFGMSKTGQRLIYSFLPKMPYSPGSFTEAQLRWIIGHYPEDFAASCRLHAADLRISFD
jgi:hypothetical protein